MKIRHQNKQKKLWEEAGESWTKPKQRAEENFRTMSNVIKERNSMNKKRMLFFFFFKKYSEGKKWVLEIKKSILKFSSRWQNEVEKSQKKIKNTIEKYEIKENLGSIQEIAQLNCKSYKKKKRRRTEEEWNYQRKAFPQNWKKCVSKSYGSSECLKNKWKRLT